MAAKQSPPRSRMRSGKRGVVGRELQVGPVGDDELLGVGEAEQAVDAGRSSSGDASSSLDEEVRADPRACPTSTLEADDVAAAAALQRASRTAAPDPRPLPRSRRRCRGGGGTCRCPITSKPGKRRSRKMPISCSERQEADRLARQADEAVERGGGMRQQRLHAVAVAARAAACSARARAADWG